MKNIATRYNLTQSNILKAQCSRTRMMNINYYSTARNNLRNYFYHQAQGNCNMNLKRTKLKVDKRLY